MQRQRKAVYRLVYVCEYLKDAEAILRSEAVRGNNGRDLSESDRERLLAAVSSANAVAGQVMSDYYRKFAPGAGIQVTQREMSRGA